MIEGEKFIPEGATEKIENPQNGAEETSRQKELREMFSNLEIPISEKEKISFSSEEIEKIIQNGRINKYAPRKLQEVVVPRFLENLKNLGILPDEWKQATLRMPPLFYQLPETINSRVEKTANLLGLDKKDYTQAALKIPSLFALLPETIHENFEALKLLFDNDENQSRIAILKMPVLLTYSQERDFVHWIAREITEKEKTHLAQNPTQILQDYFAKHKTEEGFDLLKRSLEKYTAMSRKDRMEAKNKSLQK